jgi:hypothetical protein
MPIEIQHVDFEGERIPIELLRCTACDRRIYPHREPVILDQSTLDLVHPSRYRETVHKPNTDQGYADIYCLISALEMGIPYMSDQERVQIIDAINRRWHIEGYSQEIADILIEADKRLRPAGQGQLPPLPIR